MATQDLFMEHDEMINWIVSIVFQPIISTPAVLAWALIILDSIDQSIYLSIFGQPAKPAMSSGPFSGPAEKDNQPIQDRASFAENQ